MDRLLQGLDEKSGQPFVLFARYKITTLTDGQFEVLDERTGNKETYADRASALDAAGVPAEAGAEMDAGPAEAANVRVKGLISQVEALALDRIAAKHGLTRAEIVRRAVVQYLLRNMV